MTRRDRIATAFSRASSTYNHASELQELAAQRLAARVLDAAKRIDNPRVLEFGCGTGGLTRLLLPRLPGQWTVTDIAPAMIEAARRALGKWNAEFLVMNGEAPSLAPDSQDLIVSNLAAQWFEDLPAALGRLIQCLKPGGTLLVTTLGSQSLKEWRKAVAALGQDWGTPAYPSALDLSARLPVGASGTVTSEDIPMLYANGAAFLKTLRTIGATTPAKDYRPLPAPLLRRAMESLGAPCTITYEVLTVTLTRNP